MTAHRSAFPVAKRVLDLVGAVLLLVVTVPITLLVAIAVRLDSPGPILFGQLRTGQDGRRFRMWKFRTMVENAEDLKASLQHLSVVPPPDFKVPNDPRVTRVGRLLRATSLDELPQLLNVLRGDMTLVGPRPTSFAPDSYELWHAKRLETRPGLTGLWQVSGRNELDFDERLRLDIRYIEHRSLALDLKIMLLTAACVVRRSGV